jgi:hypothetical protein
VGKEKKAEWKTCRCRLSTRSDPYKIAVGGAGAFWHLAELDPSVRSFDESIGWASSKKC